MTAHSRSSRPATTQTTHRRTAPIGWGPGITRNGFRARTSRVTARPWEATPKRHAAPAHQQLQHLCDLYQPINPAKDEKDNTGWNVFGRVMDAPGDRNLVDFYLDGGLDYKGHSGVRTTLSVSPTAMRGISDPAGLYDMEVQAVGSSFHPVWSGESVVELTYQRTLNPWWQLQPDFQYIVNPGGGIANPNAPGQRIGNAAMLGLRTIIQF